MGEELTRWTTEEERANIAGIALDETDVAHFMDMVSKGLVEAASKAGQAVQDNFGLRAEVAVRLSRAVRDDDGSVSELVSHDITEGRLRARKVYKDQTKRPVTE